MKALKWLAWNNHLLHQQSSPSTPTNDRIQHANNGGELRIANLLVDGYDATTRTVYEFNCCLWRECTRCHPQPHRDKYSKLQPDRTLREMYEATEVKHKTLESQGYTVLTKWEYDWDRGVKSNENLKEFLASYERVEPLNPRDAFFGGRTNTVRLHHEVAENESSTWM